MPCHNLEIITSDVNTAGKSPVDLSAKRDELQTFVGNRPEVLPGQASELTRGNTAVDEGTAGVDICLGTWRFDFTEDKSQLRDAMLTLLSNNFDWALCRYHECDHTDDARGGCGWDNEYHVPDTASIPAEVLERFGTGSPPDGSA